MSLKDHFDVEDTGRQEMICPECSQLIHTRPSVQEIVKINGGNESCPGCGSPLELRVDNHLDGFEMGFVEISEVDPEDE